MMQNWFTDGKLGILVTWGISAVQQRGGESWPIANGDVSYTEYLSQMDQFTAAEYDPDAWAELFRRCGVKYAVLITKHHDGVALWPTREDTPSIPNQTGIPDLVGPFVDAVHKQGLKAGLYYSHADWYNLDYMEVLTLKTREELLAMREEKTCYQKPWQDAREHSPAPTPEYEEKWQRFMDFHKRQLTEILTDYAPVDLVWFDVMMKRKGFDFNCAELRDHVHSINPNAVINSRLETYGDYETPEQFIPVYPSDGPWELCMTQNDTWSFNGNDLDYKTAYEIISMFCECLGMGGNLLLNVGPDERGVIPQEQVDRLEELGRWIRKHEEAVYGTVRGLPHGYTFHSSSLNKPRDTLYLYLAHIPPESTSVKGIHNTVKRVTVLGTETECAHKRIGGAPWLNVPGTLWIDVPKDKLDEAVTVLKIELDGPLNLYSGEGVEIDIN